MMRNGFIKRAVAMCVMSAVALMSVPAFAGGTEINTIDFSEINRVNKNSGSDAGYWTQYRISEDTTKNQIVLKEDTNKAVFKNNAQLPDGYTLGENAAYLTNTAVDRALKSYIGDNNGEYGGIKIPYDSRLKDGKQHKIAVTFEAMGYSPGENGAELTWNGTGNTVVLSEDFKSYTLSYEYGEIDNTTYFELVSNIDGTYFCIDNIKFYDIEKTEIIFGTPSKDSETVSVDELEITFNNSVCDEDILNPSNYVVSQDGISVTEITKTSEKSYKIKFSEKLHRGEHVDVTIKNIRDEFDIVLDDIVYGFDVLGPLKPKVKSITPANNSINFETDGEIRITFDTDIDSGSIAAAEADINGTAQTVNAVDRKNDEIIIKPTGLEYGTECVLTVKNLRSTDGGVMEEFISKFTTAFEETVIYKNDYSEDLKGTINLLSGEIDENEFYSSPSSLKLYMPKSGSNRYYPTMPKLEIGKYYRISYKAKKAPGNNAKLLNIINSDEGAYLGQSAVTEEWQSFSYEFKAQYRRADYLEKNETETEMNPPRIACSPEEDVSVIIYMDDLKVTKIGDTKLLASSDIPKDDERNVGVNREYEMIFNYNINEVKSITAGDKKTANISVKDNRVTFNINGGLEYGKAYTLKAELVDKYERAFSVEKDFFTEDSVSYDTLKVYSGYGTPQQKEVNSDIAENEKITLEISNMRNASGKTVTPYVMMCLYNGRKMIAANAANVSIPGGSALNGNVNVEIVSPKKLNSYEYYIKIYIWNEQNGVSAIGDAVKIGK